MTTRSAIARLPIVAVLLLALAPWTALSHGLCMCGVFNLNCMQAKESTPSSCHACSHHEGEEAPQQPEPGPCPCFGDAVQPFRAPDTARQTPQPPTATMLFAPAMPADAIPAQAAVVAACLPAASRGTPSVLLANCVLRI